MRAWDAKLAALARVSLASLPTPLTHAPRLGADLGLSQLWFKRDDLLSFAFGGNKVRGLELILADALKQSADTLVTGAGPQSNHVRVTAAAAARAGLKSVAILWGLPPRRIAGNYLLTRMLGCKVRFTGTADRTAIDPAIETAVAELRRAGQRPYGIARGGACALGVASHVLAVQEMARQCARLGFQPDVVFLAAGSGATHAGWLLGVKALGLGWRVESVAVSRPADEVRERVLTLAESTAELLELHAGLTQQEIVVHGGFIGEGYGEPTPEGTAAIYHAARTEGIFLDPTYTAKAFAGLTTVAAQGRFADACAVVFLHTGGGPALFASRMKRPYAKPR